MPLTVDPELVTWWAEKVAGYPQETWDRWLTALESSHGPAFAEQVRTLIHQERAA